MSDSDPEPGSPASGSSTEHSQEDVDQEVQDSLTVDDFPINSKNPFKTDFCGSDIVLIVQGKKLHTHRLILTLNSPYFRVMLDSKRFAEASAQEIELKDSEFVEVKYDAMVTFLLHLYPVHSFKPITDDQTLMDLFSLADYFQCQHVRTKCESYVSQQLERVGYKLRAHSTLLYLHLCAEYKVKQFTDRLFDVLSRKNLSEVQEDVHFKSLTCEMQRDVLQSRASYLEARLSYMQQEVRHQFSYPRNNGSTCQCSKCYKNTTQQYLFCTECGDSFKKKVLEEDIFPTHLYSMYPAHVEFDDRQ